MAPGLGLGIIITPDCASTNVRGEVESIIVDEVKIRGAEWLDSVAICSLLSLICQMLQMWGKSDELKTPRWRVSGNTYTKHIWTALGVHT